MIIDFATTVFQLSVVLSYDSCLISQDIEVKPEHRVRAYKYGKDPIPHGRYVFVLFSPFYY